MDLTENQGITDLIEYRFDAELTENSCYEDLTDKRGYEGLTENRVYEDLTEKRNYEELTVQRGYTDFTRQNMDTSLRDYRGYTDLTALRTYAEASRNQDYTYLNDISQNRATATSIHDESRKDAKSFSVRTRYIIVCAGIVIGVLLLIGAVVIGILLTASMRENGDTIRISGSSFGDSTSSVYIGSHKVVSWSNTEVVVETGPLDAGMKEVKLETTNGFALDGSQVLPPGLNVDLTITNVYPLKGSLQGGTELTITGVGFGNNDNVVDVTVGDVPCDISTLTNTRIDCMVAQAGKTHEVNNMGTEEFGVYYAFDHPYITINKGDFVHWTWETPEFVNGIVHGIIEVNSPSDTNPKTNGFSSGIPSRNGEYRYQFTKTGTYYVWSGYVDILNIKNYAGTIEVVDASSSLGEIIVNVSGKEALHTIGGASDPVDSSVCQSVTSAKSGCIEALPSGGNSSKFNFAFMSCSTPVVDKIDQTNGTVKTTITVTGNGFSSVDCQNEISIGNYKCDVTSSSSTSVTCNMTGTDEPELGVFHQFSVRVGNRGLAQMNVGSIVVQHLNVVTADISD